MEHLIVEQTLAQPLPQEEESRMARRLDACLEQHGARWMRSYVSTDRRRVICEFEAPDAEAVRTSYRLAGVGFDRVWKAAVYTRDPESPAPVAELTVNSRSPGESATTS